MEDNVKKEDLLSDSFVWARCRAWHRLHPETTGLPVVLFIDARVREKPGEPFSKFNLDSVMFYPYKDINRTNGQCIYHRAIPMMISDNPYVPKEYENRKHELTDDELNEIKEWVAKYKTELLLTLDSNANVEEALEKCGAYKPYRWFYD